MGREHIGILQEWWIHLQHGVKRQEHPQ